VVEGKIKEKLKKKEGGVSCHTTFSNVFCYHPIQLNYWKPTPSGKETKERERGRGTFYMLM